MSDSIEEIAERIRRERSRDKRLELLLGLHKRLLKSDPPGALLAAQRALRTASAMHAPVSIARATVALANAELTLSRSDRANTRFGRAVELARECDDDGLLRAALHGHGVALTQLGRIREALEALWESLVIAERLDDRVSQASLHNSIGVAYSAASDLEFALKHYHHALEIADADDETATAGDMVATSARARANIANVYLTLRDFAGALGQFEIVRDQFTRLGDRVGIAMSESSIGAMLMELGELERADEHHRRSLAEAGELGIAGLATFNRAACARIALARGRIDEAVELLEAAWQESSSVGAEERWPVLQKLGEALAARGDLDRAIAVLDDAIAEGRRRGDRVFEADALASLAGVLERAGDAQRALALFREAIAARDAAAGTRQQAALAEARLRHEIDASRRRHDALRREKEQVETEAARQSRELAAMAMRLAESGRFLAALQRQLQELGRTSDADTRSDVRALIRQIETQTSSERSWEEFATQFEGVHGGWIERLSQRCPELSPAELKVCTLLRLNMATKEVAEILSSSTRTIEHHRARIRRRLGLAPDVQLPTFLAGI